MTPKLLAQQALKLAKEAFLAAQNALSEGVLNVHAVNLATIDNVTAGVNLIAAAEVTPKASGIFVVIANLFDTTAGADNVVLNILAAQGPVTAFSGGTASPDGSIRTAHGGAITATATGGTNGMGANKDTVGSGTNAPVSVTASTFAFTAGQTGLIEVNVVSATNLSGIQLSLCIFELP